MLTKYSLLNKIYPQSTIKPKFGNVVYVVKLREKLTDVPEVYVFRSLKKALTEVKENHSYYPHLSFEVSYMIDLGYTTDEFTFSECINYEF